MRNGAVQPVEVTDLVTDLHGLTARFDPDAIHDADVRGVITDLGQAARLVDGMRTLMARRLLDVTGGPGGPKGKKAAATDLAKATGTSTRDAEKVIDASTKLAAQPGVADALRRGELSDDQAQAVSDAVAADPSAEGELLDAAGSQSLPDLTRTCRDTRAAADPSPDLTRRRHHANRRFRSWTESDGEWKAFLSGTSDDGARIEAAIRGDHDRHFKAAHAAGRHEPDAAHRFDALLDVLERGAATDGIASAGQTDADTGPAGSRSTDAGPAAPSPAPRRSARQTKVIVVVDAAALKRGWAMPDESCDIAGIGRVSMEAVMGLIPGAHLAYVIRDGVDVSVTHLGRQATAHQRTAMEARGYECEVPGCRSTHLLEIDHVRDWAFSKQTRLADLAWLCPHHHRQKTRRAYRLTGPPGDRRWVTADGQSPPGHDPPQDVAA